MRLNIEAYLEKLTAACERYEKTAPTVAEHCNDLYIRINERPDLVTLAELHRIASLWQDEWAHPNYAANIIYKTRYALKMDTVGHAGF